MDLRGLLLAVCLTFYLPVVAQTPAIDSLRQLVNKERNVENKVFLLYDIVNLQSELDTALAYGTLREARQLTGGNKYLQAFDPFFEGQIIWTADSARTKSLYQRSITLLSSYDTYRALQTTARAWHNYGIFLQIDGKQDEYTEILLNKVIPLAKKIEDMSSVASAYNAIGTVYSNKEDYQAALSYFSQGIQAAEPVQPSVKRSMILADAYISSAGCLIYLDKSPDEVYHYLELGKQHLGQVGDPAYHADYYLSLGKYYGMKNSHSAAVEQFNQGLTYAAKSPTTTISVIKLNYEKANSLLQLGKYRESRTVLNTLLAQSSDDFSRVNRAGTLKLQAEVEARLGDFVSAYHSLKSWQVLSDSIRTVQEKAKIAEITARYGAAEKENKILKLENANRRKLFIIALAVIAALLTGGIFIVTLRNRKKQVRQQLQLMASEREVEVKSALIYGEEQERKRLARELHDGLGGTFAGIKLNLENAIKRQDISGINATVGLLDDAIREFRHTTHRLVPEHLKHNGLENNLRDFCHSLRASGVNFHFYFKGLNGLNLEEKELVIFRVLQELITNAVKHAKASNILINCIQEDRLLLLTIEDDGVGFDPAIKKEGIGLYNIRSRIKMLNGSMQIDSTEGKGTVVNIEIML